MNPRPKRGDTWTCPTCGGLNEPYRATCINANRIDKHPPPSEPKKEGGKK